MQTLRLAASITLVACIVAPAVGVFPWHNIHLYRAMAILSTGYGVSLMLCFVAQFVLRFLVFGHAATRWVGAATSAGPYDRGAVLFLGRRDYSQPALVGLNHARNVRVATADGESLGAWHALPSGRTCYEAAAQVANGRSTDDVFDEAMTSAGVAGSEQEAWFAAALYLHGNFESRAKWVSVAHTRALSTLGLHVLCIDYRGFGDSTWRTSPDEQRLCEDACAAVRWLAARGIPPARVLLYGHSLGSGVAAQAALRLQREGTPAGALVLEAPFYSIRAAALSFPIALPLLALPFVEALLIAHWPLPGLRTHSALGELTQLPLLILHGGADATVPIQHSVALVKVVQASRHSSVGEGRAYWAFEVLRGCDHLHAIFEPTTMPALTKLMDAAACSDRGRTSAAATSVSPPLTGSQPTSHTTSTWLSSEPTRQGRRARSPKRR